MREEIIELLKRKPRLTTRQISEELEENLPKISHILKKMLKMELEALEPTEEEKQILLEEYPNLKYSSSLGWARARIRLYSLKGEF